jgi:hypothetical protein
MTVTTQKSWRSGALLQALMLGVAVAGCAPSADESKTEPPLAPSENSQSAQEETSPPGSAESETSETTFGPMSFVIPKKWQSRSLDSQFLLADLRIDGSDGEARLTLSTARGGVDANLERWQGQFTRGANDPAPREETLEVAGKECRLLDLTGTFRNPFQNEEIESARLIGVAIPLDEPDAAYFCKLTGPSKSVSELREQFLEFVRSGRMQAK